MFAPKKPLPTRRKKHHRWFWWDVARAYIMMANDITDQSKNGQFARDRYLRAAETIATFRSFWLREFCYVLPRLIQTCDVCGRTAIYRMGDHGRCRLHRDNVPSGVRNHRHKLEQRAAAEAFYVRGIELARERRDVAHALHKGRLKKA